MQYYIEPYMTNNASYGKFNISNYRFSYFRAENKQAEDEENVGENEDEDKR